LNRTTIIVIFLAAIVFGVLRGLFLKTFFETNYLVKEIVVSIIEISIVLLIVKKMKK